jgi:large subunit ribosomal protein L24
MKIRKGDMVQIMVGKDRFKKGKIINVNNKDGKVLVEGLNLYKKNRKPTKQGEKGQIISIARPLPSANIQLFCKGCDKPTRVGFKFEGQSKIRFCKKCHVNI